MTCEHAIPHACTRLCLSARVERCSPRASSASCCPHAGLLGSLPSVAAFPNCGSIWVLSLARAPMRPYPGILP